MLLNEKYTGTYIYNRRASKNDDGKRNNSQEKNPDEVVRNADAFPAIIDKDTIERVKTCMDARKGRNATNQAKEPYYLSGLIRCGQCGHNMRAIERAKTEMAHRRQNIAAIQETKEVQGNAQQKASRRNTSRLPLSTISHPCVAENG